MQWSGISSVELGRCYFIDHLTAESNADAAAPWHTRILTKCTAKTNRGPTGRHSGMAESVLPTQPNWASLLTEN